MKLVIKLMISLKEPNNNNTEIMIDKFCVY